MAASIIRVTDDFLQERRQAPLDKMKDWVNQMGTPLISALQERIGIARAGKQMLDEGGEAAELGMLAKKVALDAVALDNEIAVRIQTLVDLYKDAAALFNSHIQGRVDVSGGLAEAYDERSKFYSQLLLQLGNSPQRPSVTDAELDAIKLIQLRQVKAQLGMRKHVGGPRAGRHGSSSFFTCVEKDRHAQRCEAGRDTLQAAIADHGVTEHYPVAVGSPSAPSVVECSAPESVNHASAAMKNSQSLPRGDTLDTVNNCIESLDQLKKNIEAIDSTEGCNASNRTLDVSIRSLVTSTGGPPQRSSGLHPGLDTSVVTYAIGTKGRTVSESVPGGIARLERPAGACSYGVGDLVEIFSSSSNTWVSGHVVQVDGWVLTVRYGDRERKVDLNAPGVSSYFRTAALRSASGATAFDSMLTNATAPSVITTPTSAITLEPRCVKHAVL